MMRITILFGGTNKERLVSVATAQALHLALPEADLWFWEVDDTVHETRPQTLENHLRPFEDPFKPGTPSIGLIERALDKAKAEDRVLVLGLHGGMTENGELQAMCEMRGIPFTGSGSASSHLAFDKIAAKRFAEIAGVKAPAGVALEEIETALAEYGKLMAKPVRDGSSLVEEIVLSPYADEPYEERARALIAAAVHSGRPGDPLGPESATLRPRLLVEVPPLRYMVDKSRYEDPPRWPPDTRWIRRRAALRRAGIAFMKYAAVTLLICGAVYWLASTRAFGEEDIDAGSHSLREARARAIFLCEWRNTHGPQGNPKPLDVCQDPKLPIGKVLTQFDNWWEYYLGITNVQALRDSFDAAWAGEGGQQFRAAEEERRRKEELASEERVRALHEARAAAELAAKQADEERKRAHEESVQREQAAAARHAAAVQKDFEEKVSSLSNEELCLTYAARHYPSARTELEKRQVISTAEWALVDLRHIAIGMSETALLCSWGRTRVNRTVTATGVSKQYLYGSTLVYVVDGRITAFQDGQDAYAPDSFRPPTGLWGRLWPS